MTVRHKLYSTLLVGAASAMLCTAALAAPATPPSKDCTLDTPTISCVDSKATASSITLSICAGASGAPGGISIQWETCADFLANGWSETNSSYGAISLSGNCNPNTVSWNLGSGQCKEITMNASTVIDQQAAGCGASGDVPNITCDPGCYVFRVFAHEDPGVCHKSDFSATQECHTAPCPTGDCTLTWGYWKTHGPAGCNPPGKDDLWPVSTLTIGGVPLGESDLCAILETNPGACAKGGSSNGGANAVLILEHQLIAAMLNVANGAINCGFANQAISDANTLLSDAGNPTCVGASTPLGQSMITTAGILAEYNSDQCSCPVVQQGPNSAIPMPSPAKRASWGQLKSIYR